MGTSTFKDTVGLVLITEVGGFDYSREDLELLFDIQFSLKIPIFKEVTIKLAILCYVSLNSKTQKKRLRVKEY